MDKPLIAAMIGFAWLAAVSFWVSKSTDWDWIERGDSVHSEVFRLRQDARGIRNVLILTNGLLAAIVAALLFK